MLTGKINFINRKRPIEINNIKWSIYFYYQKNSTGLLNGSGITLKNLRRTKRKNYFLRGSFALFSFFSILFLIFSPPIAFGMLFGEGLKFSIFFIWIWILNLKFFLMPKIFKQNKFALLGANILIILLWITISSFLMNLFQSENAPFYIYKISFLIRFLPPIWVTWFLWIKRGGLKR